MGQRVIRIERKRLPQTLGRLGMTPLAEQRVSEVVMRGGRIRPDANRLGKVLRGAIEMSRLRVQQRHIVVQRRVVGIRLEPLLDADDLFAHDPLARRARQPRAIRGVARHDLQPQFGHLVGRVLPVGHATRRRCGLWRFSVELSKTNSKAIVVPAGRNCGRA